MNKLREIVLCTIMLIALGMRAQTEEWPKFYLMTSQTNWTAQSNYIFTRMGQTYMLDIESLDGEFYIVSSDNKYVYKPVPGAHAIIRKSGQEVYAVSDNNGNDRFVCSGLKNVKIYFSGEKKGEPIYVRVDFKSSELPLSGTLPVMYINVMNGNEYNDDVINRNLGHKDPFDAEYWLDINGCEWLQKLGAESVGSKENPLPLQLKARGNYSRTAFSKKPFKLKLDKKQKLLGMTKSKHFALIAHPDDVYGYMRNFTAFNLGKRIGLPWSPAMQPLEVVINGNYRGLYFLTESVRVGDDRIMIEDLADNETTPELISGGYVVELDNFDEANQIRIYESGYGYNTGRTLRVTPHAPEIYSPIQRTFVRDQIMSINNSVGKLDEDLWAYLDMDDLVRYYIVCELCGHTEAFAGSTYLFRDRGEGQKWHFSPLWDFGWGFSCSNNFIFNATGFGMHWIKSIAQDCAFGEKLKETYPWFTGTQFDGIYDDLDEYVEHIREAAKADRMRWKHTAKPDSGNATSVCDNTDMDGKLSTVKSFLKNRVNWLATHWGKPDANASEPARDATAAAPLPDYATGIIPVVGETEEFNTPVRYYTVEGIEVQNPIEGNLYIIRHGSVARKVIYKR